MSDKKISQLTGATTPLAGTEVLPVVQGGATVKVSVDNLTAGKNVKAATLSVNTNSTTGKVTINGDVQAQGAFGTLSGSLGVAIGAASGAIGGNDMAVIAGDAYNNFKDLLIAPRNNGSDVGNTRFTSGDVVAVAGNLVIGTAGKGIDFSADGQAAGMTSELLDDYEEGTWTPTGNGVTYTGVTGTYTKIGDLVTVFYNVTMPATADTNQARLGGLPFASGNTTGAVASGASDLSIVVDGNTFVRFANLAVTAYKSNADLSGLSLLGQLTYKV